MRLKALSIVFGAAALAVFLLAVPTAGAAAEGSVTTCHNRPYGKGSPIVVTSARSMSCSKAATEQRRYKWTGKNTFTTPGGFRCKPSGERGSSGYQIRCSKGEKAYRIEFED